MTIGEIEYSRFFIDEPLWMGNCARYVFWSFCIILPIVLMNLMVSIASDDTNRSLTHDIV